MARISAPGHVPYIEKELIQPVSTVSGPSTEVA